jgi:energy-coupling factor transporter ATP-binding protein EcfA2
MARYAEFNRDRLDAREQRAERACRGFVRTYRRKFRDILANTLPDETRVHPKDIFDPPGDDTAVQSILREVDDVLFTLARVRTRFEQGEEGNVLRENLDRLRIVLPESHTWEAQELLLRGSENPSLKQLHPRINEFYRDYEEFIPMLQDRGEPVGWRLRIASRLTRLDILGTQAIWAFEDTRREAKPDEATADASPWPREDAVHLHGLRLANIRRFDETELSLQPPSDDGTGQWLLFLGENGTGKTTLLRSIALALIDEDIAQSFVTQVSTDTPLIRMDAASGEPKGAPGGAKGGPASRVGAGITVQLGPSADTSTVWLTLLEERERFEAVAVPKTRPPVFAYGCRRGNALGGPEREVDINPVGNVATLFDPQAHLVHADAWLRKLAFAAEKEPRDRALFEAVLDLLTDRDGTKTDPLLPGVREIEVTPDRTWVTGPGDRCVPLSALSDGYLTTLGWLVDFLARWLEYARRSGYEIGPGFAAEMPAVVLVDEIDLHLHPRWQTRLVPALARTFPRTTFVATTHNPLTLNGTVGNDRMRGAVHVIKEREDGSLQIIQKDLDEGMSADDVLTDEWFGLRSTLDDNTLALLDDHRALLRQGAAEGDPRRKALETELRRRLHSYADTPAERLAQELVASEFPDDVPDEVTDDEIARLRDLYAAAVARAQSQDEAPPEKP